MYIICCYPGNNDVPGVPVDVVFRLARAAYVMIVHINLLLHCMFMSKEQCLPVVPHNIENNPLTTNCLPTSSELGRDVPSPIVKRSPKVTGKRIRKMERTHGCEDTVYHEIEVTSDLSDRNSNHSYADLDDFGMYDVTHV